MSRSQQPGEHAEQPSRALTPPERPYGLRERIELTYRHHGGWSLAFRALTFPLRLTPLRRYLRGGRRRSSTRAIAIRWYKRQGRPVTVVIPSYRDAQEVAALVHSIRATTRRELVRIVVSDDASGPEHVAALRAIDGIEVLSSEHNRGFAANVNRGLAATDPEHDVVLLNSDMIAEPGWLACLQYAAGEDDLIGIVGAKLLYPDGRIQFGGTVRNLGAPEWFDHRFRFKPASWGPANIPGPVLAVNGACMYLKRVVLDALDGFDEGYPMAYEDVDFCLRAWEADFKVVYWPDAELIHLESTTRGTEVGERERASQQRFWGRWGEFFDARDVRTPSGALRVVYVTEDTGVGGGHRDIFEHLNGLLERGHEVELWSLGERPDWFELQAPVRTFEDYEELVTALAPVDAIKVATWWNTASPVWQASVRHGIPVYFVQDIETSYYPGNSAMQDAVLSWYRQEFRYMTISSWNRDRLRELGLDATLIPPGIDLATFRPRADAQRRGDMILALGRSNPLKNFPLTLRAWRALPEPRPELCLFGIEPELAAGIEGVRYVTAPSDEEVAELLSEAAIFVQTSVHEGFCLPPLESMATGGAVVCTDAHGNRDFCEDGVNCLVPDAETAAVTAALQELLDDPELRAQFGAAGVSTAARYAWPLRLDALEQFLTSVAEPRTLDTSTVIAPELRRVRR
ncbi:MAG TPA: glycosyltransferase [Solirubrobacteraceae bacterium]|nr:glycosyltransferase [Solirubrobacteraceae bacterium]